MGTTVTPNLSLIKPDIDEKIEEDLPTFAGWATQNAANCDAIDALFRFTNTTYAAAWTASSVNPTLGSGGSVTGKYMRLMPSIVVGHVLIDMGGAGFAAGTGNYRISLPVAINPTIATLSDSIPIGKATYYDSSAVVSCSTFTCMYLVASSLMILRPPGSTVWNATTPVVPAQNDRISAYFMYPTAVA
jgi:hypothetical protein